MQVNFFCFVATMPSFMKVTKGGYASAPIPWQVSVWNPWKPHICSGVILDQKTVLSAATCFKKLNTLKGIRVMAGHVEHKLGQNIAVKKILFMNHEVDLAILKLMSPIHLNENVLPACLPSATIPASSRCFFGGWGDAENLKWTEVNVLDKSSCQTNEPDLICTSDNKVSFGNTDSGGALICLQDGRPTIVGIAEKIQSTLTHTRVQTHIEWIKNNMESEVSSPGMQCGMIPSFMRQVNRIINGEKAKGPIPWQAFWSYPSKPRCGGTILDSKTILSAAHCIDVTFQENEIKLVAGGIDRSNQEQVRKIDKILYNQEMPYSSDTLDNDIILMKLQEPLEFNFFVQPACLPNENEDPPAKTRCLVSGWGTVSQRNPKYAEDLQWADVYISNQTRCKEVYKNLKLNNQITSNMICADNAKGKDACQGDSGGPLICGQDGIPVLTGIVSFGEGCASAIYPGVYTRVSNYLNWIKKNMVKIVPIMQYCT